jgi:hypothetical protein
MKENASDFRPFFKFSFWGVRDGYLQATPDQLNHRWLPQVFI